MAASMNRQGMLFLWSTKLPGLDGRINEWNRSSIEAAEKAMSRWVGVIANMSLGAYDIYEAQGAIPAIDAYREAWAVDFEFIAHPGERPVPVCLVARELKTGRTIRLWRDQFGPVPPYPIDAGVLFVAYYASAELGCHLALGWPMPARILDLFAEFRDHTNGLGTIAGNGLLGALAHYGLDCMGSTEKKEMRDL
jgi:hypothetical protein